MAFTTLFRVVILAVVAATAVAEPVAGHELKARSVLTACQEIAAAISPVSDVYFPGSANYTHDISHWLPSSGTNSTCSVEPGTLEDVGKILQIVGKTNTPFAVKSGGHTSNELFSSTTGVQIALYRFNEITYDPESSSASFGTGLIWDDVYSALDNYNATVAGGRVTGIGVAGFTMGGGYSWQANEHGLAIDNVLSYELVLPNGTVTNVSNSSNPDLFFALKGTYNNFGIVTKLTVRAFPTGGNVWGGTIVNTGEEYFPAVIQATTNFYNNVKDPKANLFVTFQYQNGVAFALTGLYYAGPEPPAGYFDEYLAIPATLNDTGSRPFVDIIKSTGSEQDSLNPRGNYVTFSLTSLGNLSLIELCAEQVIYWGKETAKVSNDSYTSTTLEPYTANFLTHGAPSAYPFDRSQGYLPVNIFFTWDNPSQDAYFIKSMKQMSATIQAEAISEGQKIQNAPWYPNYALYSDSVTHFYGQNLPRLQAIKKEYDPENVMGLTGGFKIVA